MLIGVSNFFLHEFYNPYLAIAHSHTPTCRHTCTPQQLYPHHLCTSTPKVLYTPLHTQQLYLHHLCTPTRTLPCTPLHTQLSHLHTHSSSFTRTTYVYTLTPTYKYLQILIAHNCHNPYLQISVNIHIPPVIILTIKIQSLQ